jgi:hypothetical protein
MILSSWILDRQTSSPYGLPERALLEEDPLLSNKTTDSSGKLLAALWHVVQ